MRKTILVSFVVVLLTAQLGIADQTDIQPAKELPDFEFVVKLDEKGATLTSARGVNWRELQFGRSSAESLEFWLDRKGVSGLARGVAGDGFLIHVVGTATGAIFESHGGTAWLELDYGCGGDTPCQFVVDQNGVRGI